jgi:hypothetical protein
VKICNKCGGERAKGQAVCKACHAIYMREWLTRPGNREKANAASARSHAKRKAAGRPIKHSEAARAAARARTKAWAKANPEKARALEVKKRANGRNARIRIDRQNRVPKWAAIKRINRFYALAQALTLRTGVKFTVDHIIPLKGDIVSGLHVPENLHVIPLADNVTKGNAFFG